MDAKKLHRYREYLGHRSDLPSSLEQTYNSVVAQIFPLRADLSRLQDFCETYLNFSRYKEDRAPLQFRAFAPWVLLEISDYGSIALLKQNVGWFAQHELIFAIPLEMYRRDENTDKLKFVDYVMAYPFTFVDNPVSISNGREVYGWPKVRVQFAPLAPTFLPDRARMLFDIRLELGLLTTPGVPQRAPSPWSSAKNRADDRAERIEAHPLEFLKVYQTPGPSLSNWYGVEQWFSAFPKAMSSYMSAMSNMWGFAAPGRDNDPGYGALRKILTRRFGDGYPNPQPGGSYGFKPVATMSPSMSVVTLKQFRDAEQPEFACYQALVVSRLDYAGFRDGGWLFDPASGDTTGGYYIDIHDSPLEPVVGALGIDSVDRKSVGGQLVYTVRPSFPFWTLSDLSFGMGEQICWRSKNTTWSFTNDPGRETSPAKYRITGGGASQEIPGPFDIPNITTKIIPLPVAVDIDGGPIALNKICNDYLNNSFYRFKPAIPSVLLWATTFDGGSNPDHKGVLQDDEITFVMVVEWGPKDDPTAKPDIAFVPLYSFVGAEWNAMTGYEIYGRYTVKSTFRNPTIQWLREQSLFGRITQSYDFSVTANVCPELEQPAEIRNLPIMSIGSSVGTPKPPPFIPMPPVPMDTLQQKSDQQIAWVRQYMSGLKLDDLMNSSGTPPEYHYSIALKQFRDAKDGRAACYQAVVGIPEKFLLHSYDSVGVTTNTELIEVDINRYAALPLVESLGLVHIVSPAGRDKDRVTSWISIWIEGSLNTRAGQDLCWRAGSEEWKPKDPIWPPEPSSS